MGIVFGVTGAEEPPFQTLISRPGYDIRHYPKYFIAQVECGESSDAFGILAKYIGVFGTPENSLEQGATSGPSPMAMTAPVISEPVKMSMTAPVISESSSTNDKVEDYKKNQVMQFVLPFHFTSIEDIPKPTNPRVTVHEIPEKNVAVSKFSGEMPDRVLKSKLEKLLEDIEKDGKITVNRNSMDWCTARYNPPFTISVFKRNEIWIKIPLPSEQILQAFA
mmetsp:Transcript_5026/g.7637  ORF Transcript_5026/g.7637 Transcript_5026/m.7637 type:complete len:221 (-) Transcript_5026:8-670(-)|eukprot:CAMPEP_0113942920 /NCGR_PEP_ID=MMETSP1339-20121228/14957_1 /TAXON_ID=94617 /ORGANISM="Fibrocapsa japonica" /LENGTH=220 /DNA_ID=CAMNT_0000947611 /DNA_START=39 /DNA_END=701 /DNA_ORIENTATION=+ /assembly_acc=CAM_ASM_000762